MLLKIDQEAAIQIAREIIDTEGCNPEYFSVVQAVEHYAYYTSISYADQKKMSKIIMRLIREAVISVQLPDIEPILKEYENAKS